MKLSRTHLAIAQSLRADITAPARMASAARWCGSEEYTAAQDRAARATSLARYLMQHFARDAETRADFAEHCGLSALAHTVIDAAPTPPAPPAPAPTGPRSIATIAREIKRTWPKVYFGAVPYLDAMFDLRDMRDAYMHDSASSVVAYFLGNAKTWRGPDAKRIKAELNAMLKGAK